MNDAEKIQKLGHRCMSWCSWPAFLLQAHGRAGLPACHCPILPGKARPAAFHGRFSAAIPGDSQWLHGTVPACSSGQTAPIRCQTCGGLLPFCSPPFCGGGFFGGVLPFRSLGMENRPAQQRFFSFLPLGRLLFLYSQGYYKSKMSQKCPRYFMVRQKNRLNCYKARTFQKFL